MHTVHKTNTYVYIELLHGQQGLLLMHKEGSNSGFVFCAEDLPMLTRVNPSIYFNSPSRVAQIFQKLLVTIPLMFFKIC